MGEPFDVCVIGGGIVGIAIAREIAMRTGVPSGTSASTSTTTTASRRVPRVAVVESGAHVLTGASGGNSGILHVPFMEDRIKNPVEFDCMWRGYRRASDYLIASGIPHRRCGSMVVARSAREFAEDLPRLHARALANGVLDVALVEKEELCRMMPELDAAKVFGGMLVPGDISVDSWMLGSCLLLDALRVSVHLFTHFHVAEVQREEERSSNPQVQPGWRLSSSSRRRTLQCKFVINAAGINADQLNNLSWRSRNSTKTGDTVRFQSAPRRGQFVCFDNLPIRLSRIVYPVPTLISKGVLLTPTVHGVVFIGPTATQQESRYDRTVKPSVTQALTAYGAQMLPSLGQSGQLGSYVGIRNGSHDSTDYIIQDRLATDGWVTVGNIRSTGATSCLGIADTIFDMLAPFVFPVPPPSPPLLSPSVIAKRSGTLLANAIQECYSASASSTTSSSSSSSLSRSRRARVPLDNEFCVDSPSNVRVYESEVTHPLSKIGLDHKHHHQQRPSSSL